MENNIRFVPGGCAAGAGFTAGGALLRIKETRTTKDLALIFSEKPCSAAGVFTTNKVKAECVKLDMERISRGRAQAIIANSGNANCCTGAEGARAAVRMAECAGKALGIDARDVVVCSTGVIGRRLPIEKIEAGVEGLARKLSKDGSADASAAIMTTDTMPKECAVEFEVAGKKVRAGAICKGSGMIHINMGTMLCFVTTDCAISPAMLRKALKQAADVSFNCVSIDGDMSTNDTLVALANGMAGNDEIETEGADFESFLGALKALCVVMAKKIAADGEGATRLVECEVRGAKSGECARGLAKQVISSNLVKAAMFGRDANCGRVLCAMGYSPFEFTPEKTSVSFAGSPGAKRFFRAEEGTEMADEETVEVIRGGVGLEFDEEKAKRVLSSQIVRIIVSLGDGSARGRAWGCDLTYDYVKINGDYRT